MDSDRITNIVEDYMAAKINDDDQNIRLKVDKEIVRGAKNILQE